MKRSTSLSLLAVSLWLGAASLASAQVPAGGSFIVNTGTAGDQVRPRPAMQPDGDFVVVWEGPDANGAGIFGQRFAASGAARGNEFGINTYTTGQQERPAATLGRNGELIVVWEGNRASNGATDGIQGRAFDRLGVALGTEFPVNSTLAGLHQHADVGRSADGRFLVTWVDEFLTAGQPFGIKARRFDSSAAPSGGEISVSAFAPPADGVASVAVQPSGEFVVAWDGAFDYYGPFTSITARRFDAAGEPFSAYQTINATPDGTHLRPSVALAPGRTIVTWTREPGDGDLSSMVARRLDAGLIATSDEFVVNTYTTGSQSGDAGQVAADGLGNFVITWRGAGSGSPYDIHAQRFDAAGLRRGAEFQVNASTPYPAGAPSIASDEVGNFVVTWEGLGVDGSGLGIAAQRFGGLGTAALEVDGAGNGVLEAGETVDLRPSWRNFNGTAQTFTAVLTAMTGPAGAAYSITDGAANYGSVGNGVIAPCTDCYSVSVSNPTRRPAMHWDASAVEGILPDAQGQQKRWLLHVGGSFSDVPASSPYYAPIETLVHHRITAGCALFTPDTFCPRASTTREPIAPLLLMAKEGADYPRPACTGVVFKDVKVGNPFCGYIEELARRGVIAGCAPTLYCPNQVIAREEIAVLLLRTLDPAMNPPPCVAPTFYNDVPVTHPFCRWIEELARRGVVSDCGGGNYCPSADVTREQAAFFVTRAFALTLYGL